MFDPAILIALVFTLVLLAIGILRGKYSQERDAKIPKILELPQSFLLFAATLIWLRSVDSRYALVAAGIGLGFLGDLFMANVFRMKEPVPFGMLAFAAGHVSYLLVFRTLANELNLTSGGAFIVSVGLCWLFAVIMWVVLVRSPKLGAIQYAALIYGLFLATVAGAAVGLALQSSRFWLLAIGTLLFMTSDLLLGAQLFANKHFRYMGDVVWITYILAQFLIVGALTSVISSIPA